MANVLSNSQLQWLPSYDTLSLHVLSNFLHITTYFIVFHVIYIFSSVKGPHTPTTRERRQVKPCKLSKTKNYKNNLHIEFFKFLAIFISYAKTSLHFNLHFFLWDLQLAFTYWYRTLQTHPSVKVVVQNQAIEETFNFWQVLILLMKKEPEVQRQCTKKTLKITRAHQWYWRMFQIQAGDFVNQNYLKHA